MCMGELVWIVSPAEMAVIASAVVISVLVYLLVRWSLRGLLAEVVQLRAAGKFYLRTLLVTMLLGALAATVTCSIDFDEDSIFMEEVWEVAQSLDGAFWALMIILLVYVVMVTILVAALRRRHEQ